MVKFWYSNGDCCAIIFAWSAKTINKWNAKFPWLLPGPILTLWISDFKSQKSHGSWVRGWPFALRKGRSNFSYFCYLIVLLSNFIWNDPIADPIVTWTYTPISSRKNLEKSKSRKVELFFGPLEEVLELPSPFLKLILTKHLVWIKDNVFHRRFVFKKPTFFKMCENKREETFDTYTFTVISNITKELDNSNSRKLEFVLRFRGTSNYWEEQIGWVEVTNFRNKSGGKMWLKLNGL